ncbi:four-carbon acid sugar kinase family protein [uncultured Algibacter sp.]|uniref:four-carbon acid sugar kinase family protein n=1 Tax=uncultured Algibacter sp. TaxID=298659 RepID=UPI00261B579C|nr:four-carbon acid sugar kinase family protein [uncultured Algibacter sp.]
MSISLSDIIEQLPEESTSDYRSLNHELFRQLNRTCVVVDDDPTGNQTVYDIPLLTNWDIEVLIEEFKKETPTFFLLTNSRSLSEIESTQMYSQISRNILLASQATNRAFTIISRSDSTLRGHFSEVDIIKSNIHLTNAITVFIPVMFEGGRVTINDTHYISNQNELTPVSETPFAQDHTFGYKNANLKAWIEEKTKGRVKSVDIHSIGIEAIRSLDVAELSVQINHINSDEYCIINALNYKDLDKVTNALLLAEKMGKNIVYRTSSSFVPSYIGLKPKPVLHAEEIVDIANKNGGLTIVGSYVPKSSIQLNRALEHFNKETIVEVDVAKILGEQSKMYMEGLGLIIDKHISEGKDVLVFTSRKLVTGKNSKSNINIASQVSNALVSLLKNMNSRPKYLLAKGGITSNDLALKGLGMKRSKVIGQIEAGIPVWEMGEETKFTNLLYIVFPGNVGNENSLLNIIKKLSLYGY